MHGGAGLDRLGSAGLDRLGSAGLDRLGSAGLDRRGSAGLDSSRTRPWAAEEAAGAEAGRGLPVEDSKKHY